MTVSGPIAVGVIGTGNIGAAHARNLATSVAGAEIAAVYDIDAPRAEAVAHEVGCAALPSVEAVIEAADAVLIASPDAMHAEQVMACIAAGKPTLCEKPLAPSASDALAIMEAEARGGRRLITMGFMRRFDRGYIALKAEIEAGAIGQPLLVHNVHRNTRPYPGHTSAQAITNSVVHEIDIMRWLLEEEIASVMTLHGRATPKVDSGVHDPQLVIFRTTGDALIDVESFVSAGYGYEVSCQVVGTEGTLTMGDEGLVGMTQPGFMGRRVQASWLGRFAEAYRAELQGWITAIRSGHHVGASTYDGYAASAIAEAAVRSGQERCEIAVDLASRPAMYDDSRRK